MTNGLGRIVSAVIHGAIAWAALAALIVAAQWRPEGAMLQSAHVLGLIAAATATAWGLVGALMCLGPRPARDPGA
jgi:hypothetical protein